MSLKSCVKSEWRGWNRAEVWWRAQASSISGKLRILRWACRRYCCCLKYTLNAPLIATNAMPPWDKERVMLWVWGHVCINHWNSFPSCSPTRIVLWRFELTLLNISLPTMVAMVGNTRAPHRMRVADTWSASGLASAGILGTGQPIPVRDRVRRILIYEHFWWQFHKAWTKLSGSLAFQPCPFKIRLTALSEDNKPVSNSEFWVTIV